MARPHGNSESLPVRGKVRMGASRSILVTLHCKDVGLLVHNENRARDEYPARTVTQTPANWEFELRMGIEYQK